MAAIPLPIRKAIMTFIIICVNKFIGKKARTMRIIPMIIADMLKNFNSLSAEYETCAFIG